MSDDKPREFWILEDTLKFGSEISSDPKDHACNTVVFRVPICNDNPNKAVRLIEYSEAERLQKERDQAMEMCEKLVDSMEKAMNLTGTGTAHYYVLNESLKEYKEWKVKLGE